MSQATLTRKRMCVTGIGQHAGQQIMLHVAHMMLLIACMFVPVACMHGSMQGSVVAQRKCKEALSQKGRLCMACMTTKGTEDYTHAFNAHNLLIGKAVELGGSLRLGMPHEPGCAVPHTQRCWLVLQPVALEAWLEVLQSLVR